MRNIFLATVFILGCAPRAEVANVNMAVIACGMSGAMCCPATLAKNPCRLGLSCLSYSCTAPPLCVVAKGCGVAGGMCCGQDGNPAGFSSGTVLYCQPGTTCTTAGCAACP